MSQDSFAPINSQYDILCSICENDIELSAKKLDLLDYYYLIVILKVLQFLCSIVWQKISTCRHGAFGRRVGNSKSEMSKLNQLDSRAEDYDQVLNLDIKCTVCNIDLMWMLLVKKQIFKHPVLEVIICEGCSILCSNPEKDACAWCCRLKLNETCYSCQRCHEKFCSSCIIHNFGNIEIDKIRIIGVEFWICYLCTMHKLFYPRGKCDAAIKTASKMQTSEQEVDDSICAICMGNFESNKKLSCEHQFHSKCLEKWLEVNRSCPVCRNVRIR